MILALLIGVVAGLRAMTAPAAVSWAAQLGALDVAGTWLGFLGRPWTTAVLTLFALGELVTDQLPSTPSRTVPVQFGTRVVVGAVSGAAVGGGSMAGLVAGVVGALIGTLGGHGARARLAATFGNDRPAALIEDAVAVGGALLIVLALP